MNDLVNDGFVSFENRYSGFWSRALPDVVEYAGVKYFVEDYSKWVHGVDLPNEFYAHELLGVDPGNIESVTDFVSRWGLVFDPARYGESWYFYREGRDFAPVDTLPDRYRLIGAIKTNIGMKCMVFGDGFRSLEAVPPSEFLPFLNRPTSILIDWAPTWTIKKARGGSPLFASVNLRIAPSRVKKFAEPSGFHVCTPARAVSVSEAATAIGESQKVVRVFFALLKNHLLGKVKEPGISPDGYGIADFIEGVTSRRPRLELGVYSSLLQTVFAQMQETMLSPDPWKICENRECGHPFKHKRNSPNMKPLTSKNPPRVRYCCEECRNREAYLRRKDSLENHPDHGIRRA